MKNNPSENKKTTVNRTLFLVLSVVCLVNFIAHLCFYPALPAIVPTHWTTDGTVDGESPKVMALLLAALPGLLLVLFRVLPGIDPKAQNYEKFKPVWNGFVTGVTLFMCVFTWVTELSVFGLLPEGGNGINLLVCGGCGLLFILLGNYMPRIKQNYTFGCKTPWALADEHNWVRTQRMGGLVFVCMGIFFLLWALLGSMLGKLAGIVFLVGLLGGCAWIYIYSYLVFCGKMK